MTVLVPMKSKKNYPLRILLLTCLLIVLYLTFFGEYNLMRLWTLKKEAVLLQDEIVKNEASRKEMLLEIEKLKTDEDYVERIAREQFRMGKKGEKVYLFGDKDNEK